jgi:hypothetical protein
MTDHPGLTPFQTDIVEQLSAHCAEAHCPIDRVVHSSLPRRGFASHHVVQVSVHRAQVWIDHDHVRVEFPDSLDVLWPEEYPDTTVLVAEVLDLVEVSALEE